MFDGKYERNGKKETTNLKDWFKQWRKRGNLDTIMFLVLHIFICYNKIFVYTHQEME